MSVWSLPGVKIIPTPGKVFTMRDRGVLIVAIICATLVALGTLVLLGWLTANGHGTEALFTVFGSVLVTYLQQLHGRLAKVDQQTNGTQTKLIEAVAARPAVDVSTSPADPAA